MDRDRAAIASTAGLALAILACGGGSSTRPDADPAVVDADPNAPDADPNAPDADPTAPDAGPSVEPVFDHRHTGLEAIPASCIEAVKSSSFVFHYAHRSHGSQIVVGAESIEAAAPTYGFAASYCSAPGESNVLRMWDGMLSSDLVTPEDYWATSGGLGDLRSILDAQPSIRYTMWAWSFEIAEQTEGQIQDYLDAMNALENEYPNVTFVYMTGPAQGTYQAVNRFRRNQQIRDYAKTHGKVLYDFEDLEAWWNGDYHTEVVEGVTLPMEHPHYSLDTPGNVEYEYTHTTRESCENKARAFWWMVARLEGCPLP